MLERCQFFTLIWLLASHARGASHGGCTNEKFKNTSGSCQDCDGECLEDGGRCNGEGLDGCVGVCSVFREDPDPIPVLGGRAIRIHDDDHVQIHKMAGAYYQIKDFDSFADRQEVRLTANTNETNIVAVYHPKTGRLDFTGMDWIENYEKVINRVYFNNTAKTPDKEDRYVAFSINDGDHWSDELVMRIEVELVNNHPPELTLTPSSPYVENGEAVPVFSNVSIFDFDHMDIFLMASAMIWVELDDTTADNACAGEGYFVLNVAESDYRVKVIASNSSPSVIKLVGNAPARVYERILLSVNITTRSYQEPPGNHVYVKVVLRDGKFNTTATSRLSITTVNDSPPQVTFSELDAIYTIGTLSSRIAEDVKFFDCDDERNHKWEKVEVKIASMTSDYANQTLGVDTSGHPELETSMESNQQLIIIEGNANFTTFEAVLRTLTYSNAIKQNFSCPAERNISVNASDGKQSTRKDFTVVIESPNSHSPVASGTQKQFKFTEDGDPVAFFCDAEENTCHFSVTDEDILCGHSYMQSATVVIENAHDGADENVSFSYIVPGMVVGEPIINGSNATFTLTGKAHADMYSKMIGSITYQNIKDEPTLGDRRILVYVSDGNRSSNAVVVTISLVSVNDKLPVLNLPGKVFEYTENKNATSFASLNISDADSSGKDRKVKTMRIYVESPPNKEKEKLVNTSSIPHNMNISVTFFHPYVLLRTASDSYGELPETFNDILTVLAYRNDADEPTPGQRKITFEISGNSNSFTNSNVVFINVTGVNDNPTFLSFSTAMGGLNGSAQYTERSPPIPLVSNDTNLSAYDKDLQPVDVPIKSLSVHLFKNDSALYCKSCANAIWDSSGFNISFGVNGSSFSDVISVVKNVTFKVTREEPRRLPDEIKVKFVVTDIDGLSGTSYVTVQIDHICDPGSLYFNTSQNYYTAFQEASASWVPVAPSEDLIRIENPDSDYLQNGSVKITKNLDPMDRLRVNSSHADFQVSYNASVGELFISSKGNFSQYKKLISQVQFQNTDGCLLESLRRLEFTFFDDCGAPVYPATTEIRIIPVDIPPMLNLVEKHFVYYTKGIMNVDPQPLPIFPGIHIDNCDGENRGNLTSVNITIKEMADYPDEMMVFNMLNETGLMVDTVKIDDHTVRYVLQHTTDEEAPASSFVSVLNSTTYINSAKCPFEISHTVIVTVIDRNLTNTEQLTVKLTRIPAGPKLSWNATVPQNFTGSCLYVLNDPGFDVAAGDLPFIHKAVVEIVSGGASGDKLYVETLDVKVVNESPQKLLLEYDGPFSLIDAPKFELILRKVKFNSTDTNCSRNITVKITVWDSPVKRKSNSITVFIVTIECPVSTVLPPPSTPPPPPSVSTQTPTLNLSSNPSLAISTSTPNPVVPSTTLPPAQTSKQPTPTSFVSPSLQPATVTTIPATETPTAKSVVLSTSSLTLSTAPVQIATSKAATLTPVVFSTPGISTTGKDASTAVTPTPTPSVEPTPIPCSGSRIELKTQANVDELGETKCNVVNGDLVIFCGSARDCFSDRFSLVNLTNIRNITGKLEIKENRMKTLEGLENVKAFGSLSIESNTELTTLKHLRKNTYEHKIEVSEIQLQNNLQRLEDLDGLRGITAVTGDVALRDLSAVTDFTALSHLKRICTSDGTGGSLIVEDGRKLVSFQNLSSLTDVCGVIQVHRMESLTSFDGLNNLKSVGTIDIRSNDVLLSTGDGFQSLESITGIGATNNQYAFLLYGNDKLADFTTTIATTLKSVKKQILIRNNKKLCAPSALFDPTFWTNLGAESTKGIIKAPCSRRRRK
eukprot:m.101243 g.101243  ORF g.101243 m.101243 type:complete len:1797 (+) comp37124_c1_seq11:630-6020(+)